MESFFKSPVILEVQGDADVKFFTYFLMLKFIIIFLFICKFSVSPFSARSFPRALLSERHDNFRANSGGRQNSWQVQFTFEENGFEC